MPSLNRRLQLPVPTNPRPTLHALILAIRLNDRASLTLTVIRNVLMPTMRTRPLHSGEHAHMGMPNNPRPQPLIHTFRHLHVGFVVALHPRPRLRIISHAATPQFEPARLQLRPNTELFHNVRELVARKVEPLTNRLKKVDVLMRAGRRHPQKRELTHQVRDVERDTVVSDNRISFVQQLPCAPNHCFVPVVVVGHENHVRFAVPLRDETHDVSAFHELVQPNVLLPQVEHVCGVWSCFDVEREDADLFARLLLHARLRGHFEAAYRYLRRQPAMAPSVPWNPSCRNASARLTAPYISGRDR